MATQQARLHDIIESAVNVLGYELVGIEQSGGDHTRLLRVYVDAPGGITLDMVEQASRQISSVLDVEDPFPGSYQLEVSSPGLNRPLFTAEHYQRFIGREIKCRLRQPLNGQRQFRGVIQEVQQDEIVLRIHGDETIRIAMPEIEKANLVPDL